MYRIDLDMMNAMEKNERAKKTHHAVTQVMIPKNL